MNVNEMGEMTSIAVEPSVAAEIAEFDQRRC